MNPFESLICNIESDQAKAIASNKYPACPEISGDDLARYKAGVV